jgi:hypothetical protein
MSSEGVLTLLGPPAQLGEPGREVQRCPIDGEGDDVNAPNPCGGEVRGAP